MIHAVDSAATDADDPLRPSPQCPAVTVGVQDRRGLDPPVHILGDEFVSEEGVHPDRALPPEAYGVRVRQGWAIRSDCAMHTTSLAMTTD